MSKYKVFIATLLLIPSLAFATNQCATTDQEFRDMLTMGPQTAPVENEELGLTGSVTMEYHKDGILDQHISFSTAQANGTIDLKANWDVTNAVFSIHLISATHSDTHNKKLNKDLDNLVKGIKANPDVSVSFQDLGLCDGKRSVNSVIPFATFLKK